MERKIHHLRIFFRHNRFVVAIVGAICISLLLVVISVAIYVRDGVILLDLSRPSYAPVREKINKTDDSPAFDSTGKIDSGVMKDFRSQLDAHTNAIDKLGGFDTTVINDKSLQLEQ